MGPHWVASGNISLIAATALLRMVQRFHKQTSRNGRRRR